MKTVLETLESGTAYLEKRGVESARLNMQHLLAKVLGCSRLDLYLQFDRPLGEGELGPLREMVRRRGAREPLQHVLGDVEFCGRTFRCDARALVPRPETEELAAFLVQQTGWVPEGGRVADVGTGSGVLGLTVAAAWEERGVRVLGIDLAEEALALAAENRALLELTEERVTLRRGDLLEGVEERFHLIVANLPYIAAEEIDGLPAEVRRDPRMALEGGARGTELIERFLPQARERLEPGGRLALEIGAGQAERLLGALEREGFVEIASRRDLGGIDRVLTARRPERD